MTERENAASRPEALKQKPSHPKRFYEHVAIKDEGDRAAVLLDGKTVRTPGKAPFVLPNAALAEAIAEEWRGQGGRIDPSTMPLTRLANSVIDGVKGNEGAVIDDILKYAGSDLLCYRAEGPKGLVALQSKHWDPILAWAKQDFGAPMRLSEGVMHVEQPPNSLDALKERLQDFDPWSLAALHVMTGLSGSALLALAVALRRITPEEAWAAAHVDEDWQIGQWGEDEEAKVRRANRHRDFTAAARLLTFMQGAPR
jgi:chaperone required for assembly of F1-ATPase